MMQLQNEKKSLAEQLQDNHQKIDGHQKAISLEVAKVKKPLETRVKVLNENLKTAQSEIQLKENMLQQLRQQSKELSDGVKLSQQKEIELKTQMEVLQQQLQKVKDSMTAQIAQERSQLQANIKSLEDQLSQNVQKFQEKENQITALNAQKQSVATELAELKKAKNSLQEGLVALTEKLNATKDDLMNKIKTEQQRADLLEQQKMKEKERFEGVKKELQTTIDMFQQNILVSP